MNIWWFLEYEIYYVSITQS